MIRITAIVQDAVGGKDGLVVLNVKGRHIIEKLKEIGKQMTGALSLINSDGYYLISPNPEEEWAFMYPEKIGKSLKTTSPHLWSDIKAAGSRQFTTPGWLVTFATVDMASLDVFRAGYRFHTAESWKIVSLIPPELLIPEWRNLFIFGALSILLIMVGACFYWATANVNKAEAEKTIFENEEKFRRVTQTMEDTVIMVDENDIIQFWSDSGSRMLGYSAKETLGRRFHDIVFQGKAFANVQKKRLNFLKKDPKDRRARIVEANAVRKDGTGLPVEISIMPLVQNGKQFAVGIVKDLSEKKKAEEEKKDLLELSATDGLTGLANRRSFDQVLQDEYTRHSRSGGDLSLIFIDVDHFKAFNDAYGHINGDRSLQRVAHVLGKCAHRRSDLVARYGGEEFA
ncbi:MAG: sensor domain-containing diguanylate cyclase, partial [Desulfobacterales bacterium]|nr:sensor domain-containing diguanylate cyclase [Desulfobacterales bacterium]